MGSKFFYLIALHFLLMLIGLPQKCHANISDIPESFYGFKCTINDYNIKHDFSENKFKIIYNELMFLEMTPDTEKYKTICTASEKLFKDILVKNKRYENIYDEILKKSEKIKLTEQEKFGDKRLQGIKKQSAYLQTLIKGKFGDKASRCDMSIRIKNYEFPVLYQVTISITTPGNDYMSSGSGISDIDFCAPENVSDALIETVRKLFKRHAKAYETYKDIKQ